MLNKFEEIARKLELDIKGGKYVAKLPSEQALAKIYKTTHVTAAKALNLLREENIVIRERGKGTFVNPDFLNEKEIALLYRDNEINQKVLKAVKAQYPQLRINKAEGETNGERLKKCDLAVHTSVFPSSYEKYFSPVANQFSAKDNESLYYTSAFQIHRGESLYYGIPFIFSPFVLIYNKTLLKQIGYNSLPANLSYADLVQFDSDLKKDNKVLFASRKFRYSTVMSYIFQYQQTQKDVPVYTNPKRISEGLDKMEPLFRSGISSAANFSSGNALFAYTCRQSVRAFKKQQVEFEWDLCPLPEGVGGFRTSASESIFVAAASGGKEFLREVAESYLSPEVQAAYSTEKYGIPVLKSAAIDSLEPCDYRDDLFFSEIKRCCFNYSFLGNEFMGSFNMMTEKYFNNDMSYTQYRKEVLDLYNLYELSQKNANAAFELMDA